MYRELSYISYLYHAIENAAIQNAENLPIAIMHRTYVAWHGIKYLCIALS